jgi:hypothetical protein
MLAEEARYLASTREDSQCIIPLYGLVLAPSGNLQAYLEVFCAVC